MMSRGAANQRDRVPTLRSFCLEQPRTDSRQESAPAQAHADVMRLLLSSGSLDERGDLVLGVCDGLLQVAEELSSDVTLDAADDLLFAEAFGGSPRDVVLRGLV
jgi:hypothetical protein